MRKEGDVVAGWVEVVDHVLSKGRRRGLTDGRGTEESVERERGPRVVEPLEEMPAWTREEGGDLGALIRFVREWLLTR